ncbi:hypothetical protein D915_001602 [Fasciola hepatica]|uniref:EGF-like domain-containing protein n=1 Tax=Fasciola hepatica TaxID=6192 RepID=A0A4E0S3L2_FASHE|nr:hypothetical protein D915_001602 [Fasciola hepatica]
MMGADHSKDFEQLPSVDKLPDSIGCDSKGTVLCKESSLNCLNGGVCALFMRENDDTCVEKCKCPPAYMGDHCEFYVGFYSATIGLVVGLFLAILLIIFIGIFIWYCCSRKKRKNEELESGKRGPERAFLANRIDNQKKVGSLDYQTQTNPSTRTAQNSSNDNNAQIPRDYSSRSFSIYDNVSLSEEYIGRLNNDQSSRRPAHPADSKAEDQETVQLLDKDYEGSKNGHGYESTHQTTTTDDESKDLTKSDR